MDIGDRLDRLLASEPAALADPFSVYARLREEAPAYQHEAGVFLSRHEDVKAVIADNGTRFSRAGLATAARAQRARARLPEQQRRAYDEFTHFESMQLIRLDAPEHERVRRIVHRAFTPGAIQPLRPLIERRLDELLAELPPDGVVDLMQLAFTLPLGVIAEVIGVPDLDVGLVHEWSGAISRAKGTSDGDRLAAGAEAVRGFGAYVEAMVEERRGGGHTGDVVSALIDAEETETLSLPELTANLVALIWAGHETTMNLLSIGLYELLRNPGQWRSLCADPELAAAATEELLRYTSPGQWQQRVVLEPWDCHGVEVPAGETVYALLAGANRDPRAFADAEALDIGRGDARNHLALGFGPHFCLGATLTRLEGEIFFSTLARRYPDVQLAADEVAWRGSAIARSLATLPVELGAPAAAATSR